MLQFSRLVTVLLAGIAFHVLLSWTAEPSLEQGRKQANQPEPMLQAEDARKALIEIVESPVQQFAGPNFLDLTLNSLKNSPPRPDEELGADWIKIGPYACNLKTKTFAAILIFPDAPRHQFCEYMGVFQRTAAGKWRAKLTKAGYSL